MASKTIEQIRVDTPAVLPINPDTCLLLDQQTDQPVGEQSTVATLSELMATGGRVVSTGTSYTTAYGDYTINATASSITISIGSDMGVGSIKVIRRLAAYDGNAVILYPPSGATFEGRASISLYGQYSFVEIERVSATVFAVRDIYDRFSVEPVLRFGGASVGIVYAVNTCTCVVTKNKVTINGRIQLSSKGSSTGLMTITIPIIRAPIDFTAVAISYLNGVSYTGMLTAYINLTTQVEIIFPSTSESGALSNLTNTNIDNAAYIMFSGSYITQ